MSNASDPKTAECNFHLSGGVYIRRYGDAVEIVRAADYNEPGELLCKTDLSGFASIVATLSPHREGNGSYAYVLDFLQHGTMFCAGCGCRMTAEDLPCGTLSVINAAACKRCYEQKFKPFFDWGLEARKHR